MLGGKTSRAQVPCRQTPLSRLAHVVRLLGIPELFVLFASKALVVVALAFEQLLKVRFAVEFTVKGSKGAETAATTGKGYQTNRRTRGRERERGVLYLSLALQCLQQKQVEWKTKSLATNFSIG